MPYKDRLGDRRSDLRFEIIGQLWGSLETVEHLPLRNLARGGALVESRLPINPEMVRSVRLALGDQVNDIQVRVRHVTAEKVDGADRYPGRPGVRRTERVGARPDRSDRRGAPGRDQADCGGVVHVPRHAGTASRAPGAHG